MSSEVEYEAIRGVPGDLPEGEQVLWQGRPEWRALAREAFKVRWLAAYFTIFVAVRALVATKELQGTAALWPVVTALLLSAGCLGILSLMAWAYARATVYTITNCRVIFRIGVALPMSWNLPFKRLLSADLKARKDGEGDIVLRLVPPDRIAWLHLWPHVAPWNYVNARPTLRAIAEPERVAKLLGEAVQAWALRNREPVSVAAHDGAVGRPVRGLPLVEPGEGAVPSLVPSSPS